MQFWDSTTPSDEEGEKEGVQVVSGICWCLKKETGMQGRKGTMSFESSKDQKWKKKMEQMVRDWWEAWVNYWEYLNNPLSSI